MNQKGQISLMGILGIGASVLIFAIGGYVAQTVRTDDKIDTVNTQIGSVSERAAKLEEAINTIKLDNSEIRRDIKEILRLIR